MTKVSPQHIRFAIIATDVAVFTIMDGRLMVRLIRVDRPPYFSNARGLPGGLIAREETADETALRLVRDKAHLDPAKIHIEQLYTFSNINRDPRGRVVAVAYLALVPWEKLSEEERSESEDAWWSEISQAGNLAYDHDEILLVAISRMKSRVTYTTLMSKIMPKEFTLTELEQAYENTLDIELDKRNFRKKVLKLKILTALPHKQRKGKFRPAQLYRFTGEKVREINII